ncbi:hypothetical protein ACFLYC_00545 [Chloroflexota bacterium]
MTITTSIAIKSECQVAPNIWETGNIRQINSLLSLREAELALAKSLLTGYVYSDWYIHNRVRDLVIKIDDLKRWLAEAIRDKGNED